MEFPLVLDRLANETLQAQIFEQVRSLILDGALRPGEALPPSRFLAERMDISRNTALLAYEKLISEGYIETRGTSGTFVSSALPDALLGVNQLGYGRSESLDKDAVAESSSPLLCYAGCPSIAHRPQHERLSVDFWIGRSDPSTFPVKTWRQIIDRKMSESKEKMTQYGDPAGLRELRVEIAKHLGRTRGMTVTPEMVIVTNGSQDALNLVCRLVDARQHPFYIENPCYQGAAYLFLALASEVVPVPVDADGLVVDKLPENRPGILFVTPSHQYPTGVTLSLPRRIRVLDWAQRTNSYIIEDDYDSDFRYDGPPLTSLAGLDRNNRVFYIGTFSKSIGAGLRLGYAVVPEELADGARVVKSQMNSGQPWLEQAALAEFMKSGNFYRHLRRVRTLYKARRDKLISLMTEYFDPVEICGQESGLHIAWRLPDGGLRARDVERMAKDNGVGVYALNSGAAYDFDGSARQDLIVLGYSSVDESEMEKAISVLFNILASVQ